MHSQTYTCHVAEKDIRQAIALIDRVAKATDSKLLKGSLKQISKSLEPIAKNMVFQFYKEDENNKKGLFK